MLRLGIHRSLWVFGVLQAVSTAGFAVLARVGASLPVLAGVIAFESVTGGMGTSAFVAFMASLTDRRFTATQYALLTSIMGLPRVHRLGPDRLCRQTHGVGGVFHRLHAGGPARADAAAAVCALARSRAGGRVGRCADR